MQVRHHGMETFSKLLALRGESTLASGLAIFTFSVFFVVYGQRDEQTSKLPLISVDATAL